VPKLTVVVPAAARVPGLRVTVSGMERAEGSWGVPIPTDPGQVQIEAEAPAHAGFRTSVRVEEGRALEAVVPSLDPAGVSSSQATPGVPIVGASPLRPTGIVLGGLGVVALGVGTAFGLTAISKWNDSNAQCPQMTCDKAAVSLAQDAKQAATLSDVSLAVGAAAVAAGVVLFLVGAPRTLKASASSIEVAF
jgi:serine/threonine-protein kinase